MKPIMTVGELRAELAGYRDTDHVLMRTEDGDGEQLERSIDYVESDVHSVVLRG